MREATFTPERLRGVHLPDSGQQQAPASPTDVNQWFFSDSSLPHGAWPPARRFLRSGFSMLVRLPLKDRICCTSHMIQQRLHQDHPGLRGATVHTVLLYRHAGSGSTVALMVGGKPHVAAGNASAHDHSSGPVAIDWAAAAAAYGRL